MPKRTGETESYRDNLLESLTNPEDAANYLNACFAGEDPRVFLLALGNVADAHGGILALSRDTHLNRESLYSMLSKSGNPSLDGLAAVLKAWGLRLAVQPETPPRRPRRAV
jgi:probable addiction module antidote protein